MLSIKRFWFAMVMVMLVLGCSGGDSSGKDSLINQDGEHASYPVGSTWTDPATGYEWQVKPSDNNGNGFLWHEAQDYCKGLDLDGGGWHLPTISELRTLIRGCANTQTGGECGITDDCLHHSCWNGNACDGCDRMIGPGPDGIYGPSELQLQWKKDSYGDYDYWSSSSDAHYSGYAWGVDFDGGYVGPGSVDARGACCVRLGH